ncbi:ABC transporter permease [Lyngbya confervoides]|uniref:ABC transporter permease n=1 Tax=Lyngbya confervoides BDU141951 TaxID=1574623 RepID=A0ABD4SZJ3_9CYAN|nr:ABC transporter permease [Lyngbya confervoides]MCM1981887.1 ABC transporter permease [Lyngbya confervoides BDU141951]
MGLEDLGLYLLKRLLRLGAVLLGISLLVFGLLHLIPGDPAVTLLGDRATPEQIEALRDRLGLNQPLPLQYLAFLGRVIRLDLGTSIFTGVPIWEEIRRYWPATLELALAAMAIAVMIGIPLGVIAAVQQHRWVDQIAMVASLLGVSMPVYWLGLLLVYGFAVHLQWLPPSGRLGIETPWVPQTGFLMLDALIQGNGAVLWDGAKHLVLPAVTLSTIPLATLGRMTRSTMVETLSQDYIRTARAKGVAEGWVVVRHGLKNALLPVVTLMGLEFGTLLGGAILTETIFSWPGIGTWIYDGILQRDYPVVQGGVLFVACVFVIVNLFVDLSYQLLDPRIRLQ